jgi:hypothetical protein
MCNSVFYIVLWFSVNIIFHILSAYNIRTGLNLWDEEVRYLIPGVIFFLIINFVDNKCNSHGQIFSIIFTSKNTKKASIFEWP